MSVIISYKKLLTFMQTQKANIKDNIIKFENNK